MAETRPNCDFCDGATAEQATHGCKQCQAYFCSGCLEVYHSRGAYSKHEATSLETEKLEAKDAAAADAAADNDDLCPDHQGQMKLFCKLCNIPICMECKALGNHLWHPVQNIADASAEVKNVVKRLLLEIIGPGQAESAEGNGEDAEDAVKDNLTSGIQSLLDNVQESVSEHESEIDKMIDGYVEELQKIKDALKERSDKEKTFVQKTLGSAIEVLQESSSGASFFKSHKEVASNLEMIRRRVLANNNETPSSEYKLWNAFLLDIVSKRLSHLNTLEKYIQEAFSETAAQPSLQAQGLVAGRPQVLFGHPGTQFPYMYNQQIPHPGVQLMARGLGTHLQPVHGAPLIQPHGFFTPNNVLRYQAPYTPVPLGARFIQQNPNDMRLSGYQPQGLMKQEGLYAAEVKPGLQIKVPTSPEDTSSDISTQATSSSSSVGEPEGQFTSIKGIEHGLGTQQTVFNSAHPQWLAAERSMIAQSSTPLWQPMPTAAIADTVRQLSVNQHQSIRPTLSPANPAFGADTAKPLASPDVIPKTTANPITTGPVVGQRRSSLEQRYLQSFPTKLFQFLENRWLDRGVGNIMFYQQDSNQQGWLCMHCDGMSNSELDHPLTPEMELSPMPAEQGKAWWWQVSGSADLKLTGAMFAARFQTTETATEFKRLFDSMKGSQPKSPAPTTSVQAPTTSEPPPQKNRAATTSYIPGKSPVNPLLKFFSGSQSPSDHPGRRRGKSPTGGLLENTAETFISGQRQSVWSNFSENAAPDEDVKDVNADAEHEDNSCKEEDQEKGTLDEKESSAELTTGEIKGHDLLVSASE